MIIMIDSLNNFGMKNALEKISGIPADSETASFVEAEYEKIAEKQV